MDEFEFIDSIKQTTYSQSSLIKGIGDDAAVFRTDGYDIVSAVDTFVENVHFSKKTMTWFQVGYRVLAANISDMAAMGAQPKYFLVSMVIPRDKQDEELQDIYAGMKHIASQYKMDLIGGDTVSGDQLVISITIIGYVKRGKARYRNQARPNDIVFVTGTLGASRAGLEILLKEKNYAEFEQLIKKHQMPEPRVHFSSLLEPIDRLSLNDISDGIANELREIAKASNVTITIKDEKIPIEAQLKQFTKEQQFNWKYYGGEDFELVGTVAEKDWRLVQKAAAACSIQITNIGKVTYHPHTNGQVFLQQGKKLSPLANLGYIHLK